MLLLSLFLSPSPPSHFTYSCPPHLPVSLVYLWQQLWVAEGNDLSVLGDLGQVLPMFDGAGLLGVVLQAANHIHDVLILKHYLKARNAHQSKWARETTFTFKK